MPFAISEARLSLTATFVAVAVAVPAFEIVIVYSTVAPGIAFGLTPRLIGSLITTEALATVIDAVCTWYAPASLWRPSFATSAKPPRSANTMSTPAVSAPAEFVTTAPRPAAPPARTCALSVIAETSPSTRPTGTLRTTQTVTSASSTSSSMNVAVSAKGS